MYVNLWLNTSVLELLIPGKFISREGNKFRDSFGTRLGFDPIGLPNVLVVAIVWPPTVSRICSRCCYVIITVVF